MSSCARTRLATLSAHFAPPTVPQLHRQFTSAAAPAASVAAHQQLTPRDRGFYSYSLDIQSRWADNDQYGHLNNAHYYALFDTVINTFLINKAGLRPNDSSANPGNAIGVVAESGCKYYNSVSFPDMIEARLAVIKLGKSSVVYQVGIFKKLEQGQGTTTKDIDITKALGDVAATGHFCHVFVDNDTRRPVPIPERIRTQLETLLVKE